MTYITVIIIKLFQSIFIFSYYIGITIVVLTHTRELVLVNKINN